MDLMLAAILRLPKNFAKCSAFGLSARSLVGVFVMAEANDNKAVWKNLAEAVGS